MNPELTPAYGRDYKSKAEVLDAWISGKDFIYALTGQYINVSDAQDTGYNIRYKKFRNIAVVEKVGDKWRVQ